MIINQSDTIIELSIIKFNFFNKIILLYSSIHIQQNKYSVKQYKVQFFFKNDCNNQFINKISIIQSNQSSSLNNKLLNNPQTMQPIDIDSLIKKYSNSYMPIQKIQPFQKQSFSLPSSNIYHPNQSKHDQTQLEKSYSTYNTNYQWRTPFETYKQKSYQLQKNNENQKQLDKGLIRKPWEIDNNNANTYNNNIKYSSFTSQTMNPFKFNFQQGNTHQNEKFSFIAEPRQQRQSYTLQNTLKNDPYISKYLTDLTITEQNNKNPSPFDKQFENEKASIDIPSYSAKNQTFNLIKPYYLNYYQGLNKTTLVQKQSRIYLPQSTYTYSTSFINPQRPSNSLQSIKHDVQKASIGMSQRQIPHYQKSSKAIDLRSNHFQPLPNSQTNHTMSTTKGINDYPSQKFPFVHQQKSYKKLDVTSLLTPNAEGFIPLRKTKQQQQNQIYDINSYEQQQKRVYDRLQITGRLKNYRQAEFKSDNKCGWSHNVMYDISTKDDSKNRGLLGKWC